MAISRKSTGNPKTAGAPPPLLDQHARTLTDLPQPGKASDMLAWTRAEAGGRLDALTLGWGIADGPVGPLLLAWAGEIQGTERLCWLGLARDEAGCEALFRRDWGRARTLRSDREAAAWADSTLSPEADRLPLLMVGTPFQAQIWRLLLDIPWGRVASYHTVAVAAGKPRGARAVGAAVGANPVAIVVPCHRVVGASGHLHGYAWGLDAKHTLLAREWANPR